MAPGRMSADDEPMLTPILFLVALGLLAAFGAGRAGVKATEVDSPGRRNELSVLCALLGLAAMVCLAGAYWAWRFTVEFSF